jgi:threonine dehydrogenase-like Zn-dependent dehydrogenase
VIAVDGVPSRLERAKQFHPEAINFNREDPIQTIVDLTDGYGMDRAIDAVGVDSERPKSGPAAKSVKE